MNIMLWLIIIIIALILFSTGMMTFIMYYMQYSKRMEANVSKWEDADLKETAVAFSSGKHVLIGTYYWIKNYDVQSKNIIILVHGYGLTHLNYYPEIKQFAEEGNLVFAYDMTGCGESTGENPKGFGQFVLDIRAAVKYVNHSYPDRKVILFGHSTGAFGVAAYLKEADSFVDKAICVSGFSSPGVYARDCMKSKLKFLAYLFPFWVSIAETIKFGKIAAYTGFKGISQFNKPVVIIQGSADTTVPVSASLYAKKDLYRNPQVECRLVEGADHFPMRK